MIRQFLLGQLGEGERASIEDRLFDDAGFLDRLLDTEDDLLDAYVRGSLSPCEREQVERRLLANAEASGALQVARGLALQDKREHERAVAPRPVRNGLRIWFPAVALAGSLAALAVSISLWQSNARWEERLVSAQRAAGSRQPPARLLTGSASPVFSFVLEPGLFRGGPAPTVKIPPAVSLIWVRLVVTEPELISPVTVSVLHLNGQLIRGQTAPVVEDEGTRVADVAFAAALLPPGDYLFRLSSPDGRAREATYEVSLVSSATPAGR